MTPDRAADEPEDPPHDVFRRSLLGAMVLRLSGLDVPDHSWRPPFGNIWQESGLATARYGRPAGARSRAASLRI